MVPLMAPISLALCLAKNKNALKYNLKIKEALYIRQQNCGPNRGLNEDMGSHVTTTQWAPIFNNMSI